MMSNDKKIHFDSADISERLVGITPIYLNNFLQRGLYGLKASVQPGEVRAKRRLFSREDVFGIALVWMLFESGLRTEPIIRVLKDVAGIGKTAKPNANLAAKKLLDTETDYLLVIREPRRPSKTASDKPDQQVKMIRKAELQEALEQSVTSDLVVIPVGQKFEDVSKRLEILS
jgi:hypothetical protein